MQYSLKKCVTRYNKDDLLALKTCKLAQSPPACLYDPRIMRLNIVTHSEGYESQLKEFRGLLLPNLSLSTLDPNLLVLLNNYQKSMLPSNYNYVNNGKFFLILQCPLQNNFFVLISKVTTILVAKAT